MCGNVDSPYLILIEFGERSPCAAWAAFFMRRLLQQSKDRDNQRQKGKE